jgi:hypothetical protein
LTVELTPDFDQLGLFGGVVDHIPRMILSYSSNGTLQDWNREHYGQLENLSSYHTRIEVNEAIRVSIPDDMICSSVPIMENIANDNLRVFEK